jgi:hypothetical protein
MKEARTEHRLTHSEPSRIQVFIKAVGAEMGRKIYVAINHLVLKYPVIYNIILKLFQIKKPFFALFKGFFKYLN